MKRRNVNRAGAFLKGKGIYLAPLTGQEDLEVYAGWLNDTETTRYMGSGRFPATPEMLRGYIERGSGNTERMLLGIFDIKKNTHIGNITLQQIDWRNRSAEIGILIGDKGSRGKGYGKEAIGLLACHAFMRLNLRKLYAGVIEGNTPSLKAFESIGFKVEGVLREHFYLDGKYLDCLRLGLLRAEFDQAGSGKRRENESLYRTIV